MEIKFLLTDLALSLAPDLRKPVSARIVVGNAPIYVGKDIIGDAVNSQGHTTLLAAVKAAGLMDVPKAPGPLTITDAKGDRVHVTTPGAMQSNGVILVVDRVPLPG